MNNCTKQTDDPISRQAAIDAVYESAVGRRMLSGHKDLITILNNLPSSQQWIPVSERLPDEDLLTGMGKQFSNSVLMTVYDKNDEDTIVDY